MILHLVLVRPHTGLGEAERRAFVDALAAARAAVPSVRDFHVGTRLADGPAYLKSGFPDFPYAAVIAFRDRAELDAYLSHPAHAALSRYFNSMAEAALVYDFDVVDGADAARLLGRVVA